jgi:ABC-type glycerol-3-phosphate transport system substrate-binding protein
MTNSWWRGGAAAAPTSGPGARAGRTRREALALAGAGASGALAACAPGSFGGRGAPPGPSDADLKGTTIEYWQQAASTTPFEAARVKVLQNFAQQSGLGVTVNPVEVPGLASNDVSKVIAAMAADQPPDLITHHNFFLADFFSRGGTVEIDKELKADKDWARARASAYPELVKGLSWKGKLYAVPFDNSYFLMYYSPTLLTRAGLQPPARAWTWDDFTGYRKAASPPEVVLYASQWQYPWLALFSLNNNAPFLTADNTRFQFSHPDVQATAEWELGLVKAGLEPAHDGTASGGYKEQLPQGKQVFQYGVPNRVATYRQQNVEFGTCTYPLGPKNSAKSNKTIGSAYGLSVFKNKDPRKQRTALLAALWATRLDSGMLLADGGDPPSYKHVVESPEFQAKWKPDAQNWPFMEALPGFVPYYNFPTFWDARTAINNQLMDIWAGKQSVRDGLAEAQRQAQALLDKGLAQGA